MRERMPLPKRMQEAPELQLGMSFYMTAFFELHTCRSLGMGEGQIPWLAIRTYGMDLDMGEDEMEEFHFLVRELDAEYLNHRAKKE